MSRSGLVRYGMGLFDLHISSGEFLDVIHPEMALVSRSLDDSREFRRFRVDLESLTECNRETPDF